MPASPIATTFVRERQAPEGGSGSHEGRLGKSEFLGERSGFHERSWVVMEVAPSRKTRIP